MQQIMFGFASRNPFRPGDTYSSAEELSVSVYSIGRSDLANKNSCIAFWAISFVLHLNCTYLGALRDIKELVLSPLLPDTGRFFELWEVLTNARPVAAKTLCLCCLLSVLCSLKHKMSSTIPSLYFQHYRCSQKSPRENYEEHLLLLSVVTDKTRRKRAQYLKWSIPYGDTHTLHHQLSDEAYCWHTSDS